MPNRDIAVPEHVIDVERYIVQTVKGIWPNANVGHYWRIEYSPVNRATVYGVQFTVPAEARMTPTLEEAIEASKARARISGLRRKWNFERMVRAGCSRR